MSSNFDNGKTLPDGQYERYLTNTEGDYVAPIRHTYVHDTCGTSTRCGTDIAETYAKNPKTYGRTFCVACKMHFPVSEFKWEVDGVTVGDIKKREDLPND